MEILKTLLSHGNHGNSTSLALFILRLASGALMITHGWGKLLKLFGDAPITFGDPIGLGPELSLMLAVFAEVLCATLIIIGLATRPATIPLIITMLVAAFVVHIDDPFPKMELPLMYLSMYLTLLITGAGKYSLDYLFSRK